MSQDRFLFIGMLLSAFTIAICTVIALVNVLRSARKALVLAGERRGQPALIGQGRLRTLFERNRPWLWTELIVLVTVLLAVALAFQVAALSGTPIPYATVSSSRKEVVQSAEWQTWRARVHEILSVEPVTDTALIDTLRIRLPALPNNHSEADVLRRDQAVADVLLSYPGVKAILADKLGIRDNFLGTGLSKPLGPTPYAATSVHEYFVENYPDTHDHVWLWKFNPPSTAFSKPIQSLIAGDGDRVPPVNGQKKAHSFDDELKEILLRVKNKDHPLPPMIRFARFDQSFYKGTLGRPSARQVFTSNLSEVWDLTVQQAAEKSGYVYKASGTSADTLFIWVIVPYHTDEFAPATWRQVLERLPEWLERKDP